MLALMTNFMVFYLAALLLERAGVICAVTAFLVAALVGTVVASMVQEWLTSLLPRRINARGSNRAESSALTTPLP
jgi:hypothetical protein